jgi:hypothetical protein
LKKEVSHASVWEGKSGSLKAMSSESSIRNQTVKRGIIMGTYLHNQDYGSFCLFHSMQYGGKTIDKLTFTIPRAYFRKGIFQYKEKMSNSFFYIESCHNQFFKLHIHGEYINPLLPMLDSVISIFQGICQDRIFQAEINGRLQRSLEKCATLNNSSVEFIRFLNANEFIFSELELAFDWFGCLPYTRIKEGAFKSYKNSIYTTDSKTYYRKAFKGDDSYGFEKDRARDSIFIIYNRGEKLHVPEIVWRIEWRLRDERSRRLLDITDLRFNMDGYIHEKGHRLRNIFNLWVKRNSIDFNWDYINRYFPIFIYLVAG